MIRSRTFIPVILLALVCLLGFPGAASAYIGPGAGFAFLTSFFVVFLLFLLAPIMIVYSLVRFLFQVLRGRRAYKGAEIAKLVIVGLDGMDPVVTEKLMAKGELPNLKKLSETGCFHRLRTTFPAISPVAWSTFITGVNPGKHNIFDFLSRNPKTYLPDLSSARIGTTRRNLKLGKYRIPLGKPEMRLLRKSKPFWSILGESGVGGVVLRVPITFPPEPYPNGMLLSAMCVPDLRGTQGTFSFYTTRETGEGAYTGGNRIVVKREGNVVRSHLVGPVNSMTENGADLKLPFEAAPVAGGPKMRLRIKGNRPIDLEPGVYTDWVRLAFRPGLGVSVHGVCRFLLRSAAPEFELYVTPIMIDPEKPALTISSPFYYAIYVAKLIGTYATLGLAEDTWALNEGVIGDRDFMEQCWRHHEEREKMLFAALKRLRRGVCVCVFDTTDRMQHMFWRTLEDDHPANRGVKVPEELRDTIPDLYRRMDDLVGRVQARLGADPKAVLMVVSDHGFKPFRRGVNLNSWLFKNGYLALKENHTQSGEWFRDVDWTRTKAYGLGLGGLYVNVKGREAQGTVEPGAEHEHVKKELIEKLSGLKDADLGDVAVREVFDSRKTYQGPYTADAPDLIMGYTSGYRASWDSVTGKVSEIVFEDNKKSWSADHCIDPRDVPGIFFCNRAINGDDPGLIDIAPTALKLFGKKAPAYMEGRSLL